jgi:hypothetical protein
MPPQPSALVDLLSGKAPEAMYDALHAERYLPARAVVDGAPGAGMLAGRGEPVADG